jgi:hypothetical protein
MWPAGWSSPLSILYGAAGSGAHEAGAALAAVPPESRRAREPVTERTRTTSASSFPAGPSVSG